MPATSSENLIRTLLAGRRQKLDAALDALEAETDGAVGVLQAVRDTIASGGTIYTCGNGGSAAEALHFAEELVGRFRADRAPIRSTCLNADPTAITCIANDYGFESIFSRPCEAMLTDQDALVVFSTSGRSPNILAALEVANRKGATTIGFLGGDGDKAMLGCRAAVVIPGDDSAAIQEVHQFLMHACCEMLEPEHEA
jgi:D-sedoheptulose 7-phosphate isomerase